MECKCVINDIENLLASAKILENPISFAYHIGKDIVVNGV